MIWTALTTLVATSLVSASSVHRRHCHIGKCNFNPSKSPQCWGNHSLDTNWYDETPDTGVTREYWLEIQNGTAAVDGVERMVLTINGSVPGPTIYADWGDNVIIHVHNALENNGTSIVRTRKPHCRSSYSICLYECSLKETPRCYKRAI